MCYGVMVLELAWNLGPLHRPAQIQQLSIDISALITSKLHFFMLYHSCFLARLHCHSGVDGNSSLLGRDAHNVVGETVSELSTIHAALIFKENHSLWIDLP